MVLLLKKGSYPQDVSFALTVMFITLHFCIIKESPIGFSRLHMARLFAWAANIPLDSASSAVVYRAVFKLSQYIRFSSFSIIFSLLTD